MGMPQEYHHMPRHFGSRFMIIIEKPSTQAWYIVWKVLYISRVTVQWRHKRLAQATANNFLTYKQVISLVSSLLFVFRCRPSWYTILSAFAKLRKTTISFVMSVCPHGTTRLPLKGFSREGYLNIFRKSVQKIQVSSKSDQNNWCFTWRSIYIFYHTLLNS
jgi:hypothetical protein